MKTQQKYYYDGFVVSLSLMGEHKKGSAFVEGITWLSLAGKAVKDPHRFLSRPFLFAFKLLKYYV